MLRRLNQDLDAAEVHGQLCGLLCTLSELDLETWLQPSLIDVGDRVDWPADSVALFQDVLDSTQAQVSGARFDFELLLPGDDCGILTRLEALASWCQGCLLGISHGGVDDVAALPGELPEFVNDLVNLSHAENYDLSDEEEDESAYMELVEYLRVGVQLFYEELRSSITPGVDEPQLH